MKVLGVHPGPLHHSKIFIRLEPLGLELIGEAVRRLGHEVRLLDMQTDRHSDYLKTLREWEPDVVALACNYLANVPEVVDLAREAKDRLPRCFVVVGGHSASFTAPELLEHGEGAIDCVLKGEGEANFPRLLETLEHDRDALDQVPGAVTTRGEGPAPGFVDSLDDIMPARDLMRNRRKYYMGVLDPCASVEFSRGCPWDCSFCSAWTFYGRSYRTVSPERVVEDLERVKEPGVFIVDDVAFLQSKAGLEIGEAIARKGIKKEYYLETRGDVLIRNKEVFRFWKDLGVHYMFLGMEAIDQEGLERYRKRTTLDKNFEALEYARELDLSVIVNLIADPDWDKARFEAVRKWCMEVPEIVNLSVATPYPGTELWHDLGHKIWTRDYRLFDIQHSVLPTAMPLAEYYEELTKTQKLIITKNLRWSSAVGLAKLSARLLMRGQTNFIKTIYKSKDAYNMEPLLRDHEDPFNYGITLPPAPKGKVDPKSLYVHKPAGRKGRAIDKSTEDFVDQTRMGVSA